MNVVLHPTFTRERVMEQHLAAGRSPWRARLAAHALPLVQDRSGASYLPLIARMVDMTPIELATLLERMRSEARIATTTRDSARTVRAR